MSRMDSFMNLSPLNTTVSRKVISFSDISAVNFIVGWNRPLSHNAETKNFARPTSHPVRGWTGKNKAFCSPGTQYGRHVIKVYVLASSMKRSTLFLI